MTLLFALSRHRSGGASIAVPSTTTPRLVTIVGNAGRTTVWWTIRGWVMSDDIVTRLRFEYASCECSGINHDCERCTTDKEAADEIERLRMEVSETKYEYQKLWEKHNSAVGNG